MSNSPTKGKGAAIKWLRAHVDHGDGGCLTWPFSRNNGYGKLGVDGKQHYAHRLMCEIIHGAAPSPDHEAAHSCGRGQFGCVNPGHLSWKTKSENQQDRRQHGTGNAWGGRGKLTDAQATEIRALRGAMPQRKIAALYGVSRANISLIMTGNLHATVKKRPGKGYSYVKASGKYAARIGVKAGSVFLGYFDSEDKARAAYLAADARVRAGLPVTRAILRGQGASASK